MFSKSSPSCFLFFFFILADTISFLVWSEFQLRRSVLSLQMSLFPSPYKDLRADFKFFPPLLYLRSSLWNSPFFDHLEGANVCLSLVPNPSLPDPKAAVCYVFYFPFFSILSLGYLPFMIVESCFFFPESSPVRVFVVKRFSAFRISDLETRFVVIAIVISSSLASSYSLVPLFFSRFFLSAFVPISRFFPAPPRINCRTPLFFHLVFG